MKTEVQITFTVQELDFVMQVLQTRPFGEVHGLIAKIVNQANSTTATPLPSIEGAQNG